MMTVSLTQDGPRVTRALACVSQILHRPDAPHPAMEQATVLVNPILRRPERLPRVRRVEAAPVVIDRADDELSPVRERINAQLPQSRFRDDRRLLRYGCLNHSLPPQKKLRGRGAFSQPLRRISLQGKGEPMIAQHHTT